MKIRATTLLLVTFKEVFRLLKQCYRHGYYCIYDNVDCWCKMRTIVLQKCNHCIYIRFHEYYTDIWNTKHTWKNYLESMGVI